MHSDLIVRSRDFKLLMHQAYCYNSASFHYLINLIICLFVCLYLLVFIFLGPTSASSALKKSPNRCSPVLDYNLVDCMRSESCTISLQSIESLNQTCRVVMETPAIGRFILEGSLSRSMKVTMALGLSRG